MYSRKEKQIIKSYWPWYSFKWPVNEDVLAKPKNSPHPYGLLLSSHTAPNLLETVK